MPNAEKFAQQLVGNVLKFHGIGPSTEISKRDAVIVKTIALVALAFDIPPTSDEPDWDLDDTLMRLRSVIVDLRKLDNADAA
jgi:hypothetical protein